MIMRLLVASRSPRFVVVVVAVGVALGAPPVSAQPVGDFSWQLEPFCNLLTLHVTQHTVPPGAVYELTGFEDQCGANERASATGTATFNHDGSIEVGVTIVTTPGATPVYLDGRVARTTLNGSWTDSAGNAGTLAPVARSGASHARRLESSAAAGSPRPVLPNGIAPGSILSGQLAPGTIGATELAPGVVGAIHIDTGQVQARVGEACASGTALRGIQVDGNVTCDPQAGSPPSAYLRGFSRTLVDADQVVQSISLAVPSAGTVLVQASGDFFLLRITAAPEVIVGARCSISLGTAVEQGYEAEAVLTLSTTDFPVGDGKRVRFALTRGFAVSAGTFTANLVCLHTLNGSSAVVKPHMTALFVPSS